MKKECWLQKNNWITAIYLSEKNSDDSYEWGLSRADVSTGELITMEGQSLTKLFDEIIKLDASEIILENNEVKDLLVKKIIKLPILFQMQLASALMKHNL